MSLHEHPRVSSVECCLEGQSWDVVKDAVVGHEWYPEVERGGCDPTVGVMAALREAVTDLFAGDAELHVGVEELRAWPDDLGAAQAVLDAGHPLGTPTLAKGAEADLRRSLERDHEASAFQKSAVQSDEMVGRA